MSSPSSLRKLPDPPELKRTEDYCKCSIQVSPTSNWYRSRRIWRGGWLKSHMPSSAKVERGRAQANSAGRRCFVMRRRLEKFSGSWRAEVEVDVIDCCTASMRHPKCSYLLKNDEAGENRSKKRSVTPPSLAKITKNKEQHQTPWNRRQSD